MSPMVEALVLWLAFAAGWAAIAAASLARSPGAAPLRFTWWGLALWLVVAIPSLAQFAEPRLLAWGMRNDAILERGEWWRVVTANLLQDGGVGGTLSNLAVLAVTLLIVGRAVSGRLAVPLFVVGGIASMLLQLQHPGAGNSMATLALTAAVAVIVTVSGKSVPLSLAGLAVVATIAVALTLLRNEHGPALLVGLLLGLLCALASGLRRSATTRGGGRGGADTSAS